MISSKLENHRCLSTFLSCKSAGRSIVRAFDLSARKRSPAELSFPVLNRRKTFFDKQFGELRSRYTLPL